MPRHALLLPIILFAASVEASWYWPFSSDEDEPPRLAELIEPASTNIDAAADFMADGKTAEALASYQQALVELERIERENPDRVKLPEFASVRTKRAYVTAAIAAIETQRARSNSRSVVSTDTSEMEFALGAEKRLKAAVAEADRVSGRVLTRTVTRAVSGQERVSVVTNHFARLDAIARFGRIVSEVDAILSEREDRASQPYFTEISECRRHAVAMSNDLTKCEMKEVKKTAAENERESRRSAGDDRPKVKDQLEDFKKDVKQYVAKIDARAESSRMAQESAARIRRELEESPDSRRSRILRAGRSLRTKDTVAARREIDGLLSANPNDAAALNLKAACLAVEKKPVEAEKIYLQAVEAAPEDYHAYYNLSRLRLGALKDKAGAKSAYADGRAVGGPKDEKFEKALK